MLIEKPYKLIVPLPPIIVYKCQNPPKPKFNYLAAFENKVRGDLLHLLHDDCFGLMTSAGKQWIGSTERLAKEKAINWWYRTYDANRVASNEKVWVNRKSTQERAHIVPAEVDKFLGLGYKLGKEFID